MAFARLLLPDLTPDVFLSVPQGVYNLREFLKDQDRTSELPSHLMDELARQVLGHFEAAEDGADIDHYAGTVGDTAQGVSRLVRDFLNLPGAERFLPAVCELIIRMLLSEDQDETSQRRVRFLLSEDARFTTSHLGSIYRRLLAVADSDEEVSLFGLARFETMLTWNIPQGPLKFNVPQIEFRWSVSHQHPDDTLEQLFEMFRFQEKFGTAFPQFAQFPIRMQVAMVLRLRDQIPLPPEWHIDVL